MVQEKVEIKDRYQNCVERMIVDKFRIVAEPMPDGRRSVSLEGFDQFGELQFLSLVVGNPVYTGSMVEAVLRKQYPKLVKET